MELIFLGTSAGAPTKHRNMSATALRRAESKYWCLIDCAEATQHQILRTGLSLNNLQAVFITHVHGDHCYGLPGLLESAAMCGRTHPLIIVAPDGIRQMIELLRQQTDLMLGYELQFVDVRQMPAQLPGLPFSVFQVPLSHRVPSYAYVFTEASIKPKLNTDKLLADGHPPGPLWGQLQAGQNVRLEDGRQLYAVDYLIEQQEKRRVIIAGDNDSPQLLTDAADSADVLVHEATFTQRVAQKIGPAPQHSYARQVAEFAQARQIPNLILTHFSTRYQHHPMAPHSIMDLEQEAASSYQGNLFLANDFDVYRLDKSGVLTRLG